MNIMSSRNANTARRPRTLPDEGGIRSRAQPAVLSARRARPGRGSLRGCPETGRQPDDAGQGNDLARVAAPVGQLGPVVAVEMAVQLSRPSRLRERLGVEVHHGDDPHVRLGSQRPRVMRVPTAVEEDQQTHSWADDHTVPFHGGDAGSVLIVREHELAACLRCLIRQKEQAGQWVGVNVAFEPHFRPALNIQDHAIPVVGGRPDRLGADSGGQLQNPCPVQPVKPGQATPDLVGMNPAARDMLDPLRLTRKHGCAREGAIVGHGGDRIDIVLPALGEPVGHVELCLRKARQRDRTVQVELVS